jgi:hypothetical protein
VWRRPASKPGLLTGRSTDEAEGATLDAACTWGKRTDGWAGQALASATAARSARTGAGGGAGGSRPAAARTKRQLSVLVMAGEPA